MLVHPVLCQMWSTGPKWGLILSHIAGLLAPETYEYKKQPWTTTIADFLVLGCLIVPSRLARDNLFPTRRFHLTYEHAFVLTIFL